MYVIANLIRGCIFLMSSWYRADELAHRIGILYAGVALANMYVLHGTKTAFRIHLTNCL